jgi:hypothetical protein
MKNKNMKIMCLISCLILSGCGAVMASKRSTYRGDAAILAVGQTRAAVENELGAPDMLTKMEGEKTKAIYRMDPNAHSRGARNAAVAGHAIADVLTLGLWEVVGTPTELAAQDEMSNFIVIYNASDIIESVEVLK